MRFLLPPFLLPSEKSGEVAGEISNINLFWKSDDIMSSATVRGASALRHSVVSKGWLCFPCQVGPTSCGASSRDSADLSVRLEKI